MKAKWSDEVQGKGSGWDREAYQVYYERMREVIAWREEEKDTGYKRWTVARTLAKSSMEDEDETSES